jgi:glutamyl/glutaminyl-tRNA synthetase
MLARTWPYLVEAKLVTEQASDELKHYVHEALMLEQEKLVVLSDAPGLIDFFLHPEVQYDAESVQKVLKQDGAVAVLEAIKKKIEGMSTLTAANTEALCRDHAKENGLKNGQVFHPVRVAVSGRTKGPSLFHMLEVLGKARVLARISQTLTMLAG